MIVKPGIAQRIHFQRTLGVWSGLEPTFSDTAETVVAQENLVKLAWRAGLHCLEPIARQVENAEACKTDPWPGRVNARIVLLLPNLKVHDCTEQAAVGGLQVNQSIQVAKTVSKLLGISRERIVGHHQLLELLPVKAGQHC